MRKILGISILKLSIFQKLLVGIIAMLILVVIIAYVGIVSVNKLEKTSEIILKESNKYNNLQSLKLDFTELLMPANDYLIHGNKVEILNFKKLDSITGQQLEKCKALETEHFNEHFLEEIENIFQEVETLSNKIFDLKNPVGNTQGALIMEVMDGTIINAGGKIDILLSSSSSLMNKYLNANQTTNSRAHKITIGVVLLITFFLVVGGFYFAQEITKPIENLAYTTKKITLGDLSTKADVYTRTQDEIDNFAYLFNNMIDALAETTVSRNYFNSIVDRITNTLIITNLKGKITVVNQATIDLLEYTEDELIGESIKLIMSRNNEAINLKDEVPENIYTTYYTKSNVAIPVSFSKSFIYDNKNNKTGILYLALHRTSPSKKNDEISSTTKNVKLKEKIPLTNRELEIIKLIVKDYSSQEIADKLFISIRTVETHRKNIMEKLQTKSIIALVHYATQNGLV
jgi:PAS domain S-box-containing protein